MMPSCSRCEKRAHWLLQPEIVGFQSIAGDMRPKKFACDDHREEIKEEIEEITRAVNRVMGNGSGRMFGEIVAVPVHFMP